MATTASLITNCIFTNGVRGGTGEFQKPDSQGNFPQRMQSLTTDISNYAGTHNWRSRMSDGGITFIQRKIFEPTGSVPYSLVVSYTSYGGSTFTSAPISYPREPGAGLLSAVVGDYEFNEGIEGSLECSFKPVSVGNANARIATITISVIANMCLDIYQHLTSLTPILVGTQTKSVTNSDFPQNFIVVVTLPFWLNWPYWIQNVWSTQNLTPAQTIGAPSLRTILDGANRELTNMDGSIPEGLPTCPFQTETNVVDPIYFGNGSTGQTLVITLLVIPRNTNSTRVESKYYQQNVTSSSRLNNASSINWRILDRNELPFNSINATFDIIQKVVIEAY
jgi:hypothetical protein